MAVDQILGLLRLIRPEELAMILKWRNSPSVKANMYTRHKISLEEHLAWWEHVRHADDKRYFMYEYKGVPHGVVGFNKIDLINCNASWAYYANPDSSKGTGSRMEYLALEYAFNQLNLHKLYCEVLAFNTPVIKLHQKFGFKVEGIMREQHKYDDIYVDVYQLGILADEWRNHRNIILEKLIRFSRAG